MPAPPGSGFKVLIVDDEPAVLDVMDGILKLSGFETIAMTSPVEALARAKRSKFDALVLEIQMPEMSGLLLHAKLKVFDPGLTGRTVFVSGYIAKEELRRHLNATPLYLEKPFTAEELQQVVASVLPSAPRRK